MNRAWVFHLSEMVTVATITRTQATYRQFGLAANSGKGPVRCF